MSLLAARRGAEHTEGRERLEFLDPKLRMNGLHANGLIESYPARDGIGRARAGRVEARHGGSGSEQLLKFRCRGAELPRVPPARSARHTALRITGENPFAQAPLQKFRGRLPAADLAQRLIVMPAGVEIGQHAVGV